MAVGRTGPGFRGLPDSGHLGGAVGKTKGKTKKRERKKSLVVFMGGLVWASVVGCSAGMVLRADVLDRALDEAAVGANPDRLKWPVIYLSPRGRPFDQAMAHRFAACDGVTMICGRFEGIDQRVIDHHQIEEVSLGDFVLTGGEIAAQAMLDATVRLLPKVLGNQASTEDESFSDGLLEHPQYTKPAEWQGLPIPDVLQSGHHGEIAKWRKAQAEELTKVRRPDLWQAYVRKKGPAK